MHLFFALPGNEDFTRRLAGAGGWEVGRLETRRFPDGESYVRLHSDVTGRHVVLVCTLSQPDDGFLRLAFAADAARSLGAASVSLVAPYLAYMRQDRRFLDGEAVTSRAFARLVSSTFDRLVTVDPHLHRYPSLAAVYSIPTMTLHAAPLLADWIAREIEAPLLIGPDEESEQWVAAIAARIGAPHLVLRKVRHGDRDVEIDLPEMNSWSLRTPVLVDDIASSGRTLIEVVRQFLSRGLRRPVCVVVHGIFAGNAYDELAALSGRVVSTDSVSHVSNAISLAPLIAGAFEVTVGTTPSRRRRPDVAAGRQALSETRRAAVGQ